MDCLTTELVDVTVIYRGRAVEFFPKVYLILLRRAMVRPGRDRLFGRVEVDETYF